jgi:hypothetical protein
VGLQLPGECFLSLPQSGSSVSSFVESSELERVLNRQLLSAPFDPILINFANSEALPRV